MGTNECCHDKVNKDGGLVVEVKILMILWFYSQKDAEEGQKGEGKKGKEGVSVLTVAEDESFPNIDWKVRKIWLHCIHVF